MGIQIKKKLPFSIDAIDCYLEVTDVFFRDDVCTLNCSIFLDKTSPDKIKAFLYFKCVWLLDPKNESKLIPEVLSYIDSELAMVFDTVVVEELVIEINASLRFGVDEPFDSLINRIYESLKSCKDFTFVQIDNEDEETFIKRVIASHLVKIDSLCKRYELAKGSK